MTSSRETWIDHKCLVYWQSGLNAAQQHNITYTSDSSNVLLESFEVLQVVGGTGYESSTAFDKGLTSTPGRQHPVPLTPARTTATASISQRPLSLVAL